MYIDADTHVDECEDTWSYMPENMKDYGPVMFEIDSTHVPPFIGDSDSRGWFIDGQVHRQGRPDGTTGTTKATRELHDVSARIRDMDEVGVSMQVIYSSLLLNEITMQSDLMTALCQSYNRWLAERCAESGGRLQWIATAPYGDMAATLTELRWAKEHGAVGVYKRPIELDGKVAGNRYFDPFYALAAELDIPVCIHTGVGWQPVNRHFSALQTFPNNLLLGTFLSLANSKITAKFKGLRIGFIEAGAGWIPYALWLLRARDGRTSMNPEEVDYANLEWAGRNEDGALEELNFWVTCESTEDIPYLVNNIGSNHLMIGTDYGHGDRASIKHAHARMFQLPEVSPETADKIARQNSVKFYGLNVSDS